MYELESPDAGYTVIFSDPLENKETTASLLQNLDSVPQTEEGMERVSQVLESLLEAREELLPHVFSLSEIQVNESYENVHEVLANAGNCRRRLSKQCFGENGFSFAQEAIGQKYDIRRVVAIESEESGNIFVRIWNAIKKAFKWLVDTFLSLFGVRRSSGSYSKEVAEIEKKWINIDLQAAATEGFEKGWVRGIELEKLLRENKELTDEFIERLEREYGLSDVKSKLKDIFDRREWRVKIKAAALGRRFYDYSSKNSYKFSLYVILQNLQSSIVASRRLLEFSKNLDEFMMDSVIKVEKILNEPEQVSLEELHDGNFLKKMKLDKLDRLKYELSPEMQEVYRKTLETGELFPDWGIVGFPASAAFLVKTKLTPKPAKPLPIDDSGLTHLGAKAYSVYKYLRLADYNHEKIPSEDAVLRLVPKKDLEQIAKLKEYTKDYEKFVKETEDFRASMEKTFDVYDKKLSLKNNFVVATSEDRREHIKHALLVHSLVQKATINGWKEITKALLDVRHYFRDVTRHVRLLVALDEERVKFAKKLDRIAKRQKEAEESKT